MSAFKCICGNDTDDIKNTTVCSRCGKMESFKVQPQTRPLFPAESNLPRTRERLAALDANNFDRWKEIRIEEESEQLPPPST